MAINSWELFMLIFMIPIPSRLYAVATTPLQGLATYWACCLLQFIGLPVFVDGNSIAMHNVTVEIIHDCSWLRSIITIFVLDYIFSCAKHLLLV